MKLLITDLYIDCDELVKEANALYEIAIQKELNRDDLLYIESMNKYINGYEKYKEKSIRTYINDLRTMIGDSNESNS
jgi:hypothetical protein